MQQSRRISIGFEGERDPEQAAEGEIVESSRQLKETSVKPGIPRSAIEAFPLLRSSFSSSHTLLNLDLALFRAANRQKISPYTGAGLELGRLLA